MPLTDSPVDGLSKAPRNCKFFDCRARSFFEFPAGTQWPKSDWGNSLHTIRANYDVRLHVVGFSAAIIHQN